MFANGEEYLYHFFQVHQSLYCILIPCMSEALISAGRLEYDGLSKFCCVFGALYCGTILLASHALQIIVIISLLALAIKDLPGLNMLRYITQTKSQNICVNTNPTHTC